MDVITTEYSHIPEIRKLFDDIILVDYRSCTQINEHSLEYVRQHLPMRERNEAPVNIVLDLRGSRSYKLKLVDVVPFHNSINVIRAAWIVDGRFSGFFTRAFSGGFASNHKIAMFKTHQKAVDWLQGKHLG